MDPDSLAQLMHITSTAVGPEAIKTWEAYAYGVVQAIQLGGATGTVAGLGGGPPGVASANGALFAGSAAGMAALLVPELTGIVPPPGGAPTPMMPLFFLSFGQIATHIATLTAKGPAITVSQSVAPGTVTFNVTPEMIEQMILAELLKRVFIKDPIPPMQLGIAKALGKVTVDVLKTSITLLNVTGVPAGSPPPTLPPEQFPLVVT